MFYQRTPQNSVVSHQLICFKLYKEKTGHTKLLSRVKNNSVIHIPEHWCDFKNSTKTVK